MNSCSWFIYAITDGVAIFFTLGGATFSLFILGGAASWTTLGVGAWIGLGCVMRNIYVKRHSAAFSTFTIVLHGAAGAKFFRSWIIYCAAWAEVSANDVYVIGNLRGENPTLSLIHVDPVLSMKT